MKPELVLFGAGNIGRSFIAQLFAAAGYVVRFVDVNERVVEAINARGGYDVIVVHPDGREERLLVSGVSAIPARDEAAVIDALVRADFAATAVGAGALPAVGRMLGIGARRRELERPGVPLDVILAENVRDAASVVAGAAGDDAASLGLVRTSIGKMVPIVPPELASSDPLVVLAEPYATLIVDAVAFRGPLPPIPGLLAVSDINAYVDRKLFMHNLGHAAVAYLAYREGGGRTIADALEASGVATGAIAAMDEAAAALLAEYPRAFSATELAEHRDDLLRRFANRALGDTVFRVGRDLPRKLARDDRITGAMRLAARHGLPFESIAEVYRAAALFRATDDRGEPFPADRAVTDLAARDGLGAVARTFSGLDPAAEPDARVLAAISRGDFASAR